MPMIDPMLVPYMQQAFGGGGQLTERDMKSLAMSGMLGGGGGGGMLGGGGMGLGSAQPAQIAQAPAPVMHGSSGKGMNSLLVGQNLSGTGGGPGQMGGGQATYNPGTGNYTPGPGGFQAQSGLGNLPGVGALQSAAGK